MGQTKSCVDDSRVCPTVWNFGVLCCPRFLWAVVEKMPFRLHTESIVDQVGITCSQVGCGRQSGSVGG